MRDTATIIYSYYPEQKPNMEREINYTPGNETYDEEPDNGKSLILNLI